MMTSKNVSTESGKGRVTVANVIASMIALSVVALLVIFAFGEGPTIWNNVLGLAGFGLIYMNRNSKVIRWFRSQCEELNDYILGRLGIDSDDSYDED